MIKALTLTVIVFSYLIGAAFYLRELERRRKQKEIKDAMQSISVAVAEFGRAFIAAFSPIVTDVADAMNKLGEAIAKETKK